MKHLWIKVALLDALVTMCCM